MCEAGGLGISAVSAPQTKLPDSSLHLRAEEVRAVMSCRMEIPKFEENLKNSENRNHLANRNQTDETASWPVGSLRVATLRDGSRYAWAFGSCQDVLMISSQQMSAYVSHVSFFHETCWRVLKKGSSAVCRRHAAWLKARSRGFKSPASISARGSQFRYCMWSCRRQVSTKSV